MRKNNNQFSCFYKREREGKRQAHIIDSIKNRKLDMDSNFMFHCTMCGKCCRNINNILLTPQDLFKLAKGFNTTPKDFADKYCDVFIGSKSNMTVLRLKATGLDCHCVFLEGNKCSVQDFKPTVCALFPLGRFMSYDRNSGERKREVGYFFTKPNCGDKQEIQNVRNWLSGYNIPTEDEYFIKWSETLASLSGMLTDFVKTKNAVRMDLIWNLVYYNCYMKYDMQQEFLPQFIRNSDEIVKMLYIFKEIIKENNGKKGGGKL